MTAVGILTPIDAKPLLMMSERPENPAGIMPAGSKKFLKEIPPKIAANETITICNINLLNFCFCLFSAYFNNMDLFYHIVKFIQNKIKQFFLLKALKN